MLIFASTHLLAHPVGHDSGIIIMDFPMDGAKLQETIDQAVKQAMINWTNSLASTAINTVKDVDEHRLRQAAINIVSRWLVSNHG